MNTWNTTRIIIIKGKNLLNSYLINLKKKKKKRKPLNGLLNHTLKGIEKFRKAPGIKHAYNISKE